jgi:hypothetical protein
MGDNLGPNRLSRACKVFLLQIDEAEIVAHEADEPNTLVDFFDSQTLAGENGRDVDAFAIPADSRTWAVSEIFSRLRNLHMKGCKR